MTAPGVSASSPSATGDTSAGIARDRELAAEEDPLVEQQQDAAEEAEASPPEEPAEQPNELDLYGSLRVRYRSELDSSGFSDGGSRVGVQGRYQFLPRKWLFARGEAGFNLLDEIQARIDPGASDPDTGPGDTFFRRLLYVGYESPNLFLIFGKAWSVYYQVSSFTDRFAGTGGKASGTYNAGTDGGYTGTGRAENTLQTRLLVDFLPEKWGIEPFRLNIQLQDGEPIPAIDNHRYGQALGLSAIVATRQDFAAGIAYNLANVPESHRPALRDRGLDGDASAFTVALRWLDEDWYLATLLARLENHETTDQNNYFDGWGLELYAQRRLRGRWWLTAGGNWLRPDGGQPLAGDYRVQFAVIGVRCSIRELERYLYANIRGERSRDQDGTPVGDVFTVGLRWAF